MVKPDASTPNKNRERNLRKWVNRIVLSAFVVAALVSIVIAFQPKAVVVDLAPAMTGPLTVSVNEDGRTRVKDRYVISAPLAGNLVRVELEAGDHLKAGEALARVLPLPAPLLDPRSKSQAQSSLAAAQAAFRQAQALESQTQASLAYAEAEDAKLTQLLKSGGISQSEQERAQLELRTQRAQASSAAFGARVARHQVETAQAALGRLSAGGKSEVSEEEVMTLRAPLDAQVLEVFRQSEGVVQAGAPLLELGNPASLEVVVDVLTSDAVQIREGAKAEISNWGGAVPLVARVRRVEPKAFTRLSALGVEEQRVNVLLELDTPREKWTELGDGFRVEASIVVWEAKDVLKVPVSAVFKRDGAWVLYVVESGRATLKKVEIGQRTGFDAQITKGLTPGETVVLRPGEHVTEGSQVVGR